MAGKYQVRCSQCGVPNDPGALFCNRCGASLNRPGYTGTHRRFTLAGSALALAALIALSVTTFVLYTIISRTLADSGDTTTSVYSGSPGTMATLNTSSTMPFNTSTTNPGAVRGSILVRPSAATASSSLGPTNVTNFGATNVLDGDSLTAWVEGGKGTGANEWVKLEFAQPISLARIEIANGYQKDDQFFADYVRVKSLELDYSDGSRDVIQLQDESGLQIITPSVSQTQWIKFVILSVYPTYSLPQAAISDIRVYEAIR
jgi:hypothetical protein